MITTGNAVEENYLHWIRAPVIDFVGRRCRLRTRAVGVTSTRVSKNRYVLRTLKGFELPTPTSGNTVHRLNSIR